jgi:hypothetical protein
VAEQDGIVAQYEALQRLVVDNPDLERLERIISGFNIFEAIGVVRQELRHSDFLAFLLDPRSSHGLGDAFTKRFLQAALSPPSAAKISVTPLEIDLWNLRGMEVERERHRIDVLLLDRDNNLAVIIENKIDAGEGRGQLERYLHTIEHEHPGLRTLGLYLTPDGVEPSHEKYVPISYDVVRNVVRRLVKSQGDELGSNVRVLLEHYAQMLGRHIVTDSEIAELCRRIYRQHRQAMDLIIEHRPDRQGAVAEILKELIEQRPELELDHAAKQKTQFAVREWNTSANFSGSDWTESGRILLFEFHNGPTRIELTLYIGPGKEKVRQRLFEMSTHRGEPFRVPRTSLMKKHNRIYSKRLAGGTSIEEDELANLEKKLRRGWADFLEKDLPRITAALKEEQWFWE